MLTRDGMEALAQSFRKRYLPLSMMLMVPIGARFDGRIGSSRAVKLTAGYWIRLTGN